MTERTQIDLEKLPRHIGIIMDGNGRWAKRRSLPRIMGHKAGVDALERTIRTCNDLGLEVVSVYVFSTENWSRMKAEVTALMTLFIRSMRSKIDEICQKNGRLVFTGDLDGLPASVRRSVASSLERTKNNTGLTLNLVFNYGGRQEIAHAVKRIAEDIAKGTLSADAITPETVDNYLYSPQLPPVDLIIRTGGEYRVSNFMLYSSAYSELYFTDLYWPDFDDTALYEAIASYQKRDRRYGKA